MRQNTVQVYVDENLQNLLRDEDLDGDSKITIEDLGPKSFSLTTKDGEKILIKGHYALSNLLQLLAHAHHHKKPIITISIEKLFQPVLDQINEQITKYYWDTLTRTMDQKGLIELLEDPKREQEKRYLYVPKEDKEAFDYFQKSANDHPYLKLKVKFLEQSPSKEKLNEIDQKPGLLSLSIKSNPSMGNPYVVPGGRFNEMYGWDSYFIIEGLLLSEKIELALSMYEHLLYQVKHYGKVLNANRSYYLTRTQPPLLTSILLLLIKKAPHFSKELIYQGLVCAIEEYEQVWLSKERLTSTGLSRYFDIGEKCPLEVEPKHFDLVFEPFAKKTNLSLQAYKEAYRKGKINEPKLDHYFMHDRSMRESGHDTTNRLVNQCAYLNTVDLNSLLYKYEIDIAFLLDQYFDGKIEKMPSGSEFKAKALKRSEIMYSLMWNESKGLFFDYHFKEKKQMNFESATTFFTLFAKLPDEKTANVLIEKALPLFECNGGLVSTTEKSRGKISPTNPQRQWDYPFGWAPHQMLFWEGCKNYGFTDISKRLAYKWLYMILKEAKDYNGVLAEKYDVVDLSHKKLAEYGNVGLEFGLYPDGGFGWVNASVLKAQTYLSERELSALKNLESPDSLF